VFVIVSHPLLEFKILEWTLWSLSAFSPPPPPEFLPNSQNTAWQTLDISVFAKWMEEGRRNLTGYISCARLEPVSI
jgi:hypothetical protein